MPFKFSMFFNGPTWGFSESWYWNGGLSLPVPTSNPLDKLYIARSLMCSKEVTPIGWRVTEVGNPRNSQLSILPGYAVSGEDADIGAAGWLYIAKGPNQVGRRQLWLRGIPDDAIVWSPTKKGFITDAAFDKGYSGYLSQLVKTSANNWAIRHTQSRKDAGGSAFKITALSNSGTSNSVGLTFTGGVSPTDPLIISGFKKPLNKLNGTYLPDSGFQLSGGGVTLLNKGVNPFAAGAYAGGAFARTASYSYLRVTTIDPEWARSRRVGRPFFSERGRR